MDITSWGQPYAEVKLNAVSGVIDIISDKFNINKENIFLDSLIVDDLRLDELDMVELIMEVEKVFAISIPDTHAQEAGNWRVRNLINVIRTYAPEQTLGEVEIPDNTQFENTLEKDIEIYSHSPFVILKNVRILQNIRRFQVGIETLKRNGVGLHLGRPGDILEEIYDKPNHFINITMEQIGHPENEVLQPEIISLAHLNEILAKPLVAEIKEPKKKSFLQPKEFKRKLERENAAYLANKRSREYIINKKLGIKSLEPLETISVLESALLESKRKKTGQAFNRKMKQLAKMNEDLTVMRMILGIENED